MNRRLLLYVIPMILVWGSQAGVVRLALETLPAQAVIFYNLTAAVALLAVFMAVTGGFAPLRNYSAGTWLRLALAGFVGSFLYYVLLFHGLQIAGRDSVIEVNMMNYLFPIMTVIFSAWLVREQVTVVGVLSIIISFFGAYVIFTRGNLLGFNLSDWHGLALGFAAAVCWGLFTALGRRWAKEPLCAIFIYFAVGWVLSALSLLFVDGRIVPTPRELGYCMYTGMLSNCFGLIMWFKALKVGSATLVGNLTYSAAFLSVLVINRLNHSPIRPASVLGLCLIAVGVVLATRYGSRQTEKPGVHSQEMP